jgi:hypothetical protein
LPVPTTSSSIWRVAGPGGSGSPSAGLNFSTGSSTFLEHAPSVDAVATAQSAARASGWRIWFVRFAIMSGA